MSTLTLSTLPVLDARPRLRLAVCVSVGAGLTLALFWLGLVVLRVPISALVSLIAGVLSRWLVFGIVLRRLCRSSRAAEVGEFEFDGKQIRCSFDEAGMHRAVDSQASRAVAAVIAGATCCSLLRCNVTDLNLFAYPLYRWHGLNVLVAVGEYALPFFFFFLFLRLPGPRKLWARMARGRIRARATEALQGIQGPLEVDGLEAGAGILWGQIGLRCSGRYREAILQRLRSHAAEAVMNPEQTRALLQAVTVLARLDVAELGIAVKNLRQIEIQLGRIQALVDALQTGPLNQRQTAMGQEVERLRELIGARRWKEAGQVALSLGEDLEDFAAELGARLRLLAASAPRVTLSASTDPCRLLGVSASTPLTAIKKLRQRLALVYHPDLGGETCNVAKMAELNAAYDAVLRMRAASPR